ncbi:MAG: DUF262 domain-containing HNH endonuclease family protein [Bacteroidales bacterium]|nr:DUF262 domain-containing HNH endonuclease family protein [Bacteroidales bacterium]
MQASKESFNKVLTNGFKFVIPFYQRGYVWNEEQLTEFVDGMLQIYRNEEERGYEYFMGTIISKYSKREKGYNQYELVDGQQRITTFFLFFKLLSLINETSFAFAFVEEHSENPPVLVPCKADQDIYNRIMALKNDCKITYSNGVFNEVPADTKITAKELKTWPNMIQAFNILHDKITQSNDFASFKKNIVDNTVQFINMTLDDNDDPQLYFNNINSLGVVLSTADLVKNELFHDNYNDYQIYWEATFESTESRSYWYSSSKRTSDLRIDQLLLYYLQIKSWSWSDTYKPQPKKDLWSKGKGVAQNFADYIKLLNDAKNSKGKKVCNNPITTIAKELKEYSDIFRKIVPNDQLSYCLPPYNTKSIDEEYERLAYLIEKLKVSTVIPYILYVAYLKPKDLLDILKYLEAYLVRRCLMVDRTNDNFNRFFRETLIAQNVQSLDSIKKTLTPQNSKNSCRMPLDNEIKKGIDSLYFENNEEPKVLLYLLELELQNGNNLSLKYPDYYTLEHMVPQKLHPNWDKLKNVTERSINKLGNMTLLDGPNNTSASNKSWDEKMNGFGKKYKGYVTYCNGMITMSNKFGKNILNPPLKSWNDNDVSERNEKLILEIIKIWKC